MTYYEQRLKEIELEQRLKNPPKTQPKPKPSFNNVPNAFQVKTQKNRLHKLEKDIAMKQERCDDLYDKYAKEYSILEQMQRAHKLLTEKNRFVVERGEVK